MSLPKFDENTSADGLPYEVFRWLSETTMYARSTPGTADEVYDSLKIVLRLLAVRNPNAQSKGIRKALGSLIESISAQPDSEKTCLDLLGLLIRMVDAKQDSRFNSMKHLALSGLGYFMACNRLRMRQMSVNVFVICVDALKVCPPVPETLLYRNTVLRAMKQCILPTLDETSVKFAVKFSRSMIDSADTGNLIGIQTLTRCFELMADLFPLPGAKSLHKKIDRWENLFATKGSISEHKSVRRAAARFYFVVLQEFSGLDFQQNVLKIINTILKNTAHKNYGFTLISAARVETLLLLLELLIATQQTDLNFESQLDQWLASALLQLDSNLATPLFIDSIIKPKLAGKFQDLDIVSVLIRQLSLSQAPNSSKSSSKMKSKTVKPQLEGVLACLTSAIGLLGHSIQPVASSIHQATLGLILNGNQIQSDADMASIVHCLVSIIKATPTLLIPTMELCLKQMEIPVTDPNLHLRIAYVLGPTLSLTRQLSLYSDEFLLRRVMLIGFQKLQEVQDFYSFSAGWTLVMGILCLGPQEVKPLVPQLLLVLPAHLSSTSPEVLEKALSGILIFLIHNVPLLTPDVTNRLGGMLNNLWAKLEHSQLDPKIMRRLLQCYQNLLANTKFEKYPSSLLMRYVAHITSPKGYCKETGVPIESAMTALNIKEKDSNEFQRSNSIGNDIFAARAALENGLSSLFNNDFLTRSYGNDLEYSSFYLFLTEFSKKSETGRIPTEVCTSTIDLAISVCSATLPLQPERIQESVFDALLSNLKDSVSASTPRKSAVILNTASLVQLMLQGDIQIADRIVKITISTLKLLLSCPYVEAQKKAANSCGLLAKSFRKSPTEIQTLLSMAKDLLESCLSTSDDINSRSGSMMALGHILEAWSQTSLLEATFRVYDSLILDKNQQLHLSAMEGMRHALLSPDLVDQKYVKYTLKALISTYLLESHINSIEYREQAADTLVQVVSRFGPLLSSDNQEANRNRIICLADQLQLDSHPLIRVLAWNSLIELFFYARKGIITWKVFIRRWTDVIVNSYSTEEETEAALNGLLVLIKLSARSVFSYAGTSLEYALWLALDKKPNHKTLRTLLYTWLSQTLDSSDAICRWIGCLNAVVMKPRYFFVDKLRKSLGKDQNSQEPEFNQKNASVQPTAVAADEDVSLGVTSDDTNNDLFSWESRKFAIEMLNHILVVDLAHKSTEEKAVCVTTKNVGDLIKIAFATSTSQIMGLQFAGLTFLRQIIENLGDSNDPDFQSISILEQYQVQIASALSPAFSLESSPGLALVALGTTATFLGSNIVKTKEKLGRLLKILEESLESAIQPNEFKLGDIQLSVDAAKALRIAVLAVWAQIKISSDDKPHLRDLVSSHEEDLKTLWIHAIMTYGRLQAEVEAQWERVDIESVVDQISEIQFKSLMKPIFKISWLKFIHAISMLDILSRPLESIDLLVIICGLCFQELSSALKKSGLAKTMIKDISEESETRDFSTSQEAESIISLRYSILKALACILTPEVSRVLVDSSMDYIGENIPLLYRIMLVGQPEEQICVLTIARNLVAGQPDTDDKVDHFFEILKISVLPLRHLFPQLIDANAPQRLNKLDPLQVLLLRHTMNAVIDIAQVFRDVIKTDLWVCLLKAFEELNHREPAVAAPSFKRFLEILSAQVELRGVGFVVDALTVSLKRAVDSDPIMKGIFISTAILCTNSSNLVGDPAVRYSYEFGLRVSMILDQYLGSLDITPVATEEEPEDPPEIEIPKLEEVLVVLQLLVAVFRSSSTSDAGKAFAYGCLPSLCQVTASNKVPVEARKRAATSLTIYAVLDGTPGSLSIIIPTFLTLANSDIEDLCRGMLMQIIAKHPTTFRETVWTMDSSDRLICQELLAKQDPKNEELIDEETSDDSDGEITLTTFS